MITKEQLDPFIGVPFLDGGRTLDGCDCWGLYYLANKILLNREVPSYSGAYMTPLDYKELKKLLEGEKEKYWNKVDPDERLGDAVLLRIEGRPVHVGFVLEKGRMLHIEANIDSFVEDYNNGHWKTRTLGVYRYEQFNT